MVAISRWVAPSSAGRAFMTHKTLQLLHPCQHFKQMCIQRYDPKDLCLTYSLKHTPEDNGLLKKKLPDVIKGKIKSKDLSLNLLKTHEPMGWFSLWMKVLVSKLGKSNNELSDVSLGLQRLHYNSCSITGHACVRNLDVRVQSVL